MSVIIWLPVAVAVAYTVLCLTARPASMGGAHRAHHV